MGRLLVRRCRVWRFLTLTRHTRKRSTRKRHTRSQAWRCERLRLRVLLAWASKSAKRVSVARVSVTHVRKRDAVSVDAYACDADAFGPFWRSRVARVLMRRTCKPRTRKRHTRSQAWRRERRRWQAQCNVAVTLTTLRTPMTKTIFGFCYKHNYYRLLIGPATAPNSTTVPHHSNSTSYLLTYLLNFTSAEVSRFPFSHNNSRRWVMNIQYITDLSYWQCSYQHQCINQVMHRLITTWPAAMTDQVISQTWQIKLIWQKPT